MALDRKRFLAELLAVHGLFDKALTEIQMRLWCDTLAGEETEVVCRALQAHVADTDRGQFCPKPADLLRLIRGTSNDVALVAWQDVLSQARSVGRNGVPRLTGAQRAALDGIGGWTRLCNSDESEHGFIQREFLANYGAAVSVDRAAQMAAPPDVARLAEEFIGRVALEAKRG